MRIAHFVTPDCSQDHAGTGRPGTRQGNLGALDGVSRPSRLPAPRSQHIGTERPARKEAAPQGKNTSAAASRVIPMAWAWPAGRDNTTGLLRGSSAGHRGGQPGSCKCEPDKPYRPQLPFIWWPGQSVQLSNAHISAHEARWKQVLDAGGTQGAFSRRRFGKARVVSACR